MPRRTGGSVKGMEGIPMEQIMSSTGPHSNDAANQWLVRRLHEHVASHQQAHSFSVLEQLWQELTSPATVIVQAVIIAILVSWIVVGQTHFFAEFVVLSLNLCLNTSLALWTQYLAETEVAQVLRRRLQSFRFGLQTRGEMLEKRRPNCAHLVPVLRSTNARAGERRGGALCWIRVPTNLLIEGDIISMQAGETVPARLQPLNPRTLDPISDSKSELKLPPLARGQPVSPDAPTSTYRVLDCPALEQLTHVLQTCGPPHPSVARGDTWSGLRLGGEPRATGAAGGAPGGNDRPASTFDRQARRGNQFFIRILCAGVVLSLVVTAVRVAWLRDGLSSVEIFEQIISRHAMLLMPVLPLSSPLFLTILDACGNAILYNAAKNAQGVGGPRGPRKDGDAAGGELGGDDDDDSDSVWTSASERSDEGELGDQLDEEFVAKLTSAAVNAPRWAPHALDILLGMHTAITRSVNPFRVLGNVTVFCVVDNAGILSENQPMLRHVLFVNTAAAPGASRGPRVRPGRLPTDPTTAQLDATADEASALTATTTATTTVAAPDEKHGDFDEKRGGDDGHPIGPDVSGPGVLDRETTVTRTEIEIVDFIRDLVTTRTVFEGEPQAYFLANLKPVGLSVLMNTQCTCTNSSTRNAYDSRRIRKALFDMWSLAGQTTLPTPPLSRAGDEKKTWIAKPSLAGAAAALHRGLTSARVFSDFRSKQRLDNNATKGADGAPTRPSNNVVVSPADALLRKQHDNFAKALAEQAAEPVAGCMCELATLVGFDPTHTRRQYRVLKCMSTSVVHVDAESNLVTDIQHATSILTCARAVDAKSKKQRQRDRKAPPKDVQLLSRGAPALLLPQCADYFDGAALRPLDAHLRTRLCEIAEHWANADLEVFALTHAPLAPDAARAALRQFDREQEAMATRGASGGSTKRNNSGKKALGTAPAVQAASHRVRVRARAKGQQGEGGIVCQDGAWPAPLARAEQEQIFLGMAAVGRQPKLEAPRFVEALMRSGIRFAYFSKDTPARSKALATSLGLFTDWNAHISLKDRKGSSEPPVEGISKLPCGVSAIRDHLRDVDDVPLLVSLFTDCERASSREMVRIYQENGECVLCLASAYSADSVELCTQADLSMSLDPIPLAPCAHAAVRASARAREGAAGDPSRGLFVSPQMLALSKTIATMPCTLSFGERTGMTEMYELICVGRRYLRNLIQSLVFFAAACLTLFGTVLVTNIADAPPPLFAHHTLWLLWVTLPLLSGALFFTPLQSIESLEDISVKNEAHLADIRRFFCYFCLRLIPTAGGFLAVYLTTLPRRFHDGGDAARRVGSHYYWNSRSGASLIGDADWEAAVADAQAFAVLLLVCVFVLSSAGFLYRNVSLWESRLWDHPAWWRSAAAAVALQCLFSFLVASGDVFTFDAFSTAHYAILVWPVAVLACDELTKAHDARRHRTFQKRARLFFDTQLGMHSPK